MPLISVILSLVILGVVLYLVSQIPMPTVIHNIIYALAVLAVVLCGWCMSCWALDQGLISDEWQSERNT